MKLHHLRCLSLTTLLIAGPALAHADGTADVVKIFWRDPGTAAAHACFIRHYPKAHLNTHPDQNVTDMLLFVSKQEGPEPYYNLNMQVNFRQLIKPFQVAGSCGIGAEGKATLGCGIDCDGGHLSVRIKNESSLLVEIPESVRLFDPSANDDAPDAELPKGARFGADDKLFRLDRAALKDCAAVIYDDEIKAKVLKGVISQ